jgi:pimeloyl-ACP methyl ester carboxylesterase
MVTSIELHDPSATEATNAFDVLKCMEDGMSSVFLILRSISAKARVVVLAFLLVSMLLGLSAASLPVAASVSVARETGLVGNIEAETSRVERITWAPCPANPAVECGVLTLPIDYDHPNGETFDMAVARIKATNPSKRIGVLLTNPGGPGISGIDFMTFAVANAPFFKPYLEYFDIVSFDPRGVGRSRPIKCTPDSIQLPKDDAALAATFDAFSQRYIASCLQLDGPFVTKLSTNNVARDMDRLRRALGERTITYAAGSYGTALGAVYASLFPRRLRAMALDAGFEPDFRDSYVESTAAQMASFEMELQRVDVLCRRDAACRLREKGVVATFDQLYARLNAEPVTTPQGRVLTGRSLVSVVYSLLYRETAAPLIVDILANGLDGDYTLIAQFLPTVDAGVSLALYAIRCNDYGTRRQAAEYLPVDEVIGARNSRFFGRFYVAYRLATCAAWPAADPPVIRNLQQRLDVPILLLMNDFDPATPPASMRTLAHALGMEKTVVRYQGGGHTFPKNNACMTQIFADYLIHLKLPAEGTTCPGQPISFAPRSQLNNARSVDSSEQGIWGVAEPLPSFR